MSPWRLSSLLIALVLLIGCSSSRKKEDFLSAADRSFKAGELEQARLGYLTVLKLDPKSPVAIRQLGIVYHEQGAPLQAMPYLVKARDADPENQEVRKRLALSFAALGGVDEARKETFALLERQPDHAESLLLLADTSRSPAEIEETQRHLAKLAGAETAPVLLAKASLAMRQRDPDAAEELLKRAAALDPSFSSARLALATLYFSQKKTTEAGQEFQAAAELAPPRSIARIRFADFKAQTGRKDEAKAMLDELAVKAPGYLPISLLLARLAFEKSDHPQALAHLDKVFACDPDNLDSRILQAQILIDQKNPVKAIEVLETLLRRYPALPVLKFQLAVAFLQNNQVDRALPALKEAVQANPDFVEAVLLLAELNLRTGDPQAVVAAMQRFLAKRPGFPQAEILLANGFRGVGKFDEAAAVLQKSAHGSASAQYQSLLARVLFQQNKVDDARAALVRALELAPGDPRVISSLVDLELAAKNYPAALQRAGEQLAMTPEAPAAHFLQAKVHVAQRQWDAAEAALNKAIELDPNFASAYGLLVATYISANKLDRALEQLNAILEKDPKHLRALTISALIYEKQENFDKTREIYERLLAAHPEFAPAANNLAVLYAEKLNDLDKARAHALKARNLRGEDPLIADTLGWVLYKRGEFQEALALLQESAGKLPDHPEIQYHLGMASYAMGDRDRSRAALLVAAKTPPNPAAKTEIDRCLAIMQPRDTNAGAQAVAEYRALAKENPRDVMVWLCLGEALELAKAYPDAIAAYETALQVNPKLLPALVKLAQLHSADPATSAKALDLARQARALDPADPKAAATLGKVAYDAGDVAWAANLLQEAARDQASNTEAAHTLAWATYRLGQVGPAEQMMQRVQNDDSDSARREDAKLFLEMLAISRKPADLLSAADKIQGVLTKDPSYLPAQFNHALLLAARGETKGAGEVYSAILARSPDFAPAQKAYAALCVDFLNQPDRARELVTKARQTLPDDPELAQILASIQFKKEEYTAAIETLKGLSSRKPLDAKSLFVFGMCQMQLGQKVESQRTLNQALEAGLKEPFARDAKWVLKMIDSQPGASPDGATGLPPL